MEYKKLGDIATYVNGYAFKPEQRGKKGLPIIRIQDLTGNSYDLGYYEGDYPKKIELNNGDVLISWSASLGVYHWNRGKALLNQHIFKVIFDKVNINKFFFMYAVEYNLKKMSLKTHGATMKHITKKDFDNVIIPFPTLEKQGEIAQDLNIIKRIIEKYNQQINLLDELVKARFVELFGDPATNEYNWPMLNLENVSSIITYGLTVRPTYVNKGIDLISARELHKGFIEYEVAPKISFNDFQSLSDKGKPLKNDILFSKTGSIGHCALVDTDKMFAITQNAARLGLIIEKVNPVWLLYYLRMNYIQDWCKRHAKGNAVKDLQLKDIKAIPLFECPLELQNQFADFVKEVDKSRFIIKSMIKEGLL
ncbi:restriction endonuclease subunit S [Thomasclavelia ramosa]|uniref:restriction endonuclease subunit S n=1 Tax=Thomasclavelia ramosa TaxID=1547 RepID=UPI000E4ACABA|nr:restriction endonuclease subunit S [Thomasclavelia ramosa]RGH28900.1 restriction endonuclease subunit S [Coprobacillus sp. AF02-13]MBV4084488.1 restriction endonuclease subunit S [Thomasclavelia ramosa]MBV4107117.1 restriction endonuclease subunit S [Thomasclavelia ramosa]MBV4110034.1 restriction endonuclease subunit S [Thomasclavelia ramosa]MDU4087940.1 restriction endonuclease subunit S [Thomasclavelia ramosa]